jgi:hypothetical protein
VEARQRVKLSLTNRSIGLISQRTASRAAASSQEDTTPRTADKHPSDASQPRKSSPDTTVSADSPPGGWSTWWSQRGARTRSHPELGRENPPRQWYCVLRRGRVGRRQVHQPPGQGSRPTPANPSLVLDLPKQRRPKSRAALFISGYLISRRRGLPLPSQRLLCGDFPEPHQERWHRN